MGTKNLRLGKKTDYETDLLVPGVRIFPWPAHSQPNLLEKRSSGTIKKKRKGIPMTESIQTVQRRCLSGLFLGLVINITFLGCGGGDEGSKEEVAQLSYDAVIGEEVKLDELIFPALVDENEVEIDQKWAEIEAIYDSLAAMPIPGGYQPQEICDNITSIPGAEYIVGLSQKCTELTAAIGEVSNLQEAVRYAVGYLWGSNNESVTLVDGRGLALITDEGVATISVTDANGNHTHDIVINAQRVVHKIKQMDIKNDVFVSVGAEKIRSFNADGTVKEELPTTVVAYTAATGEVVLSGPGAGAVTAGQTILFEPSAVFPEGGIRAVMGVTTNGANVILNTKVGDLAKIINRLDMEHKEAVNKDEATIASTSAKRMSASASIRTAKGVQLLSAEDFRGKVAQGSSASGSGRSVGNLLVKRALLSGTWTPDFAFKFQKNGLEGVLGFKMPIHMSMKYEDWKLQRFVTSFKPTQYGEITVKSGAEIELAEVKGSSISFMIGALPVYVRPIIVVSVGGGLTVGEVELKVADYEVSCEYGVDYKRGRDGANWRPIAHYNRTFNDPTVPATNFALTAWGRVQPTLRFYGLGGPYARATIGGKLSGDVSKTAPDQNWAALQSFVRVSTGVAMEIGVETPFYDATLVDVDINFGKVLDLTREEWNSGGPFPLP